MAESTSTSQVDSRRGPASWCRSYLSDSQGLWTRSQYHEKSKLLHHVVDSVKEASLPACLRLCLIGNDAHRPTTHTPTHHALHTRAPSQSVHRTHHVAMSPSQPSGLKNAHTVVSPPSDNTLPDSGVRYIPTLRDAPRPMATDPSARQTISGCACMIGPPDRWRGGRPLHTYCLSSLEPLARVGLGGMGSGLHAGVDAFGRGC